MNNGAAAGAQGAREERRRDAGRASSSDNGARAMVVRDIIRGLYEGRFEPGQRLYEGHLTENYGISRGPVREALNSLASMGVVELVLQRGARVKILGLEEALDTLVVAQALVGLAARLAARNIAAPGAKERVEEASQKLENFDPSSTGVAFVAARDNFYSALTDMAGNAQLRAALPIIRIHLIRVQFRAVLRATDSTRLADYRKIARAVLAGQPKRAEMAARVHFDRAIAALEEFRAS